MPAGEPSGRKEAWLIHQVLFDQFVESFSAPPKELILDFDCTDDRVHGMEVGRAFHGYYYDYCFLPLYVFCGEQLLVSYLRPSNIDPAKHAWAILAKLVRTSTANSPMVLAPAPAKGWRPCPRCLPAMKNHPESVLLISQAPNYPAACSKPENDAISGLDLRKTRDFG
jgi:Transposase DDE domain group 1